MIENVDIIVGLGTTLITVIGAIVAAILGAKAGVKLATSKEVVEERAKAEMKQRIKMENNKEIIQAIKYLPLATEQARNKIVRAASYALTKLPSGLGEQHTSRIMQDAKMDIDGGINSVINEYKEIENIIFLLEYDLQINGENLGIRNLINEIKSIFEEIKNTLELETKDKISDNIVDELREIIRDYSLDKEDNNKEEKDIVKKLTSVYIEKLDL